MPRTAPARWTSCPSGRASRCQGHQDVLWGEAVRERFNAPELNLARYIKDGTVSDADNGEQEKGTS